MPRRRLSGRRNRPEAVESDPSADRSYVELARRIRDEVERAAQDDTAFVLSVRRAIDGLAHDERARFTVGVFDSLDPERQLALLRDLFDDAELRNLLSGELARRQRRSDRATAERAVLEKAVDGITFDLSVLPSGTDVTFGLFRPGDVSAAVGLGRRSDLCARDLRCRSEQAGYLTVINDTFNPRGSLAVTPDYDREQWNKERLDSHAVVRIGSITPNGFIAEVRLGARVDVEQTGNADVGRLHLGFALIGDTEVFIR